MITKFGKKVLTTYACCCSHRQKHKEETLKLKQELASLQTTSKGGQQGLDRTKKDLEKTRCAAHAHTFGLIIHGEIAV